MIRREFAQVHPARRWPTRRASVGSRPRGNRQGLAEQHPVARIGYIPQNVVMIYPPKDAKEIEVVAGLVVEAYRYASGVVPDVG